MLITPITILYGMPIMDYKLDFEKIPWSQTAPGLRVKELTRGSCKLRLAEFSEGFDEPDWCPRGHLGIVLNGIARVVFHNGIETIFQEGEIIDIPAGGDDKHKAVIDHGQACTILFFESA